MATTSETDLTQRVNAVIAAEVRPALQADGGDLELIGVDQGVVQVRLLGTCGACPSSAMALVMGIERQIREKVPEVAYVEVTG